MKIVFMGTPDFAVPSLEILLKNNYTISAVVTAPDKPRGRGQQVSFTPVKECAQKYSLPIFQPQSLKDPQFIAQLAELKPDLFVIVAFRILPKEVYSIPDKGAFNLHASLLPKYRGAAPINWAIINGEKESGVTTFFLQDKVDTGNIILQEKVTITDEMNAGELHDALSDIGSRAVLETVQRIEQGIANPQKQNDLLASPAPKIFKETCRIDWSRSAEKIHNFIRGLSPYPAAWTSHNGKVVKIFKSRRTENEIQNSGFKIHGAGEILVSEKQLFVAAENSVLEILELQQEGKKRMSAEEFLRGYRFAENSRFD
ncbi:MAG: methionyl-tRNA formyltransferase [Bacteroidota bacterium]